MAASKTIYCSSCFGAATEAQEVEEIQGGTELHFMATPKTRGFANPSKKQPEWQHQSSGVPRRPSRNGEARLRPGPGPKAPAFASRRPQSPPPPSFDNNRGLAADSKTCRGTASEKPKPGPRRLFRSPSYPPNRSQTPIQRENLLAGGPEQRLGLAGCGYSRAER